LQVAEIEAYELDMLRDGANFTPQALEKFLKNKGDDLFTAAKLNIKTDSKLGEIDFSKINKLDICLFF